MVNDHQMDFILAMLQVTAAHRAAMSRSDGGDGVDDGGDGVGRGNVDGCNEGAEQEDT